MTPAAQANGAVGNEPAGRLTYRSYLQLPTLLTCQAPRSAEHDELLFIVIHQASELWLKLCLHELSEARTCIAADDIQVALKVMSRVNRIQSQLIQSWNVLGTMTPSEYGGMRSSLASSSGFQSDQYRMLEFLLGHRKLALIAQFSDEPEIIRALGAELERPSLYDEAIRLLGRRGYPVPMAALERDVRKAWRSSPEIEQCWRTIYTEPTVDWELYDLAEKLVDLDHQFQLWRFGHLRAVERVIGYKKGTGGTDGVGYLSRVLEQRFFPELLSVRTTL